MVCIDEAASGVYGVYGTDIIRGKKPTPSKDLTEAFIDYFESEGPLFERVFTVYPKVEKYIQ